MWKQVRNSGTTPGLNLLMTILHSGVQGSTRLLDFPLQLIWGFLARDLFLTFYYGKFRTGAEVQ